MNRRRQLASFKIDFGRYRGKCLADVPRDYLDWILAEHHDATIRWMVAQYIALVGKGRAAGEVGADVEP